MAKSFMPWIVGLVVFLANLVTHLAHDASLPTVFILGDSTADVGTNSLIPNSGARANFPHNGVDFPHRRATGRFSNGFNSADYLAKLLGFKRSPPPYLFLKNQTSGHHKILNRGVNFASGGCGLLDGTGSDLNVTSLSKQIMQFALVRENLTRAIGEASRDEALASRDEALAKALFFISIGSNDIFEYFQNRSTLPVQLFISNLMTAYSNHIQALYNLGARKFGIISVAPVGCCPAQRLAYEGISGKVGCFEEMNDVAIAFQTSLNTVLNDLSSQLPEMKYSLGNAFNMTIDVIKHHRSFNFSNVDSACCGTGTLRAAGPCNRTALLCPDRRKYLFWDMFHPTQKAANLAAETLYFGPTIYVTPINFYQLVNEN